MGRRDPFAGRPHTPREHFRLHFYGAVLLLAELAREQSSLLAPYLDELRGTSLEGRTTRAARIEWDARLAAWEATAPVRLPLDDLRVATGCDRLGLTLLFVLGLVEEDPRFGALFEALQGVAGWHRPTAGLLTGWWDDPDERARARRAVAALLDGGLVEVVGAEAPRSHWALQPNALLWDVVGGDGQVLLPSWVTYQRPEDLPALEELILPEPVRHRATGVTRVLRAGAAGCVVLRGPSASGRRATLGAIARALGRGVLDLAGLSDPTDPRWRAAGPLATLLHALPVVTLDPNPGETARIPRLTAYAGPTGLRLPRHGGVEGTAVDAAATLLLGVPDVADRARHWTAGLDGHPAEDVRALAEGHRMTGGTIRRVARVAVAEAAAAGRDRVTATDVAAAGRSVRAELLDTLAARVPVHGCWDDLVVCAETRDELLVLERRCRSRERLPDTLPPAFGSSSGPGVRALFTGPSGTGKTLSARLLASVLSKDLYRLDLSTVVNKYLGETEKNLDRVLSRAETLDVVLLVDEGDALLTQRTDVQNANDRYANLETNYLLQRLESFEGIVVITTNAERHIDDAFQRRLDVVIDFPAPGAAERWAIWTLHLPASHLVGDDFLREVAARCALTGGQVRGAVLHASLLALDGGGVVTTEHVAAAVRREYRKLGAVCPLRTRAAANGQGAGRG